MAEHEGLPLAEAAAALGMSENALRKRLLRGQVQGWKVDGQWRVDPATARPGRAGRQTAGGSAEAVPGRDDLVEQLRSENTFLRQLTEHQAGVIAELTRRVPELPAPLEPAESREKPQEAAVVARSWWRKIFP